MTVVICMTGMGIYPVLGTWCNINILVMCGCSCMFGRVGLMVLVFWQTDRMLWGVVAAPPLTTFIYASPTHPRPRSCPNLYSAIQTAAIDLTAEGQQAARHKPNITQWASIQWVYSWPRGGGGDGWINVDWSIKIFVKITFNLMIAQWW